MEWNPKTPLLWDWESVELYSGRVGETPKQIQPMDWGIEGDGGIDNGPVYSSGGGGVSGSELGNGSSSRSSISVSVDSSSKTGIKESEYNIQMVKGFPEDVSKRKELGRVEDSGTSLEHLASDGSGEPLIGLKLGKRTYFEDVYAGSTIKASSDSSISASSSNSVKKSRASYQSLQTPRCQVEGCNLDLTAAKDYHRRHRVCENHTKYPKVIVAGQERRFCQQCSRFHGLSEFDEKKRSCRRRLSDHNARRRRPQTEPISFNSSRLSASFYDGRQQMDLALNRLPVVYEGPPINTTWESSSDFKIAQAKGSCIRTLKTGSINGDLHLPGSDQPDAIPVLCHDFDKLLPFKGTSAAGLNQGREASVFASNSDMKLDSRRALSLLSTKSWALAHPETAVNQLMHSNSTSMAQSSLHPVPQVLSPASSEYRQAEPRVPPFSLHNNGSHFQEFQLFKPQYESAFLNSNRMQ